MMLKTIMNTEQMKNAGRLPFQSAKALKKKAPRMVPTVPMVKRSVGRAARSHTQSLSVVAVENMSLK
jgi:hypothetical protein